MIFGTRILSSSFTRSSFELGPDTGKFDEALKALGDNEPRSRFELPEQRKSLSGPLINRRSYLSGYGGESESTHPTKSHRRFSNSTNKKSTISPINF